MAHSDLVIGPTGWNGWAVHVSETNFPIDTEFEPLSVRFQPNSFEMGLFGSVFPLDSPTKIAQYWQNSIERQPQQQRGPFNVWLLEAALETVRRQHHRDLPSRLECIFGFRCAAEAIRFACHYRTGPMAYLYEFQPGPGTVMVDMKIWDNCKWDYALAANAFGILIGMGEAYWQSATGDLTSRTSHRPELLVPP